MEQLSDKLDNTINVLSLLDEENRNECNEKIITYINQITNSLTQIDDILATYHIDNIDLDTLKLDNRKNKILNHCLFVVYWYVHEKLQNMSKEQIDVLEKSNDKLAECIKKIVL